VYVLFLHGTSRALDPQLHVHALAVNLCLRSDGTTGTIRSRDLYWHKMAAGALFRAELAHLLATELGLTIVPDGWKFKIAGVPDSLCEEFSQRRKKIELLAKEEGWSSAAALAKLAVASRPAKRNVPLAECFAHWAATADKHGFTQEAALKLLAEGRERLAAQASGAGLTRAATAGVGQARRESPKAACTLSVKPPVEQPPVATSTAAGRETAVLQAFLDAVDALASFKSHFPERDLVRETATRALACGASASEVLAAVKQGVERFEHRIE
ncbi:MAG TPA: MobF family relaxase, partial [Lacipirellulaceae bacterium]|nr:MobF family relaxase [Lacipirellulaceae bacterium]